MLEPGREISDGTLAALAMDGSFDVGQLLDQDDPLGTISFPGSGELAGMAGTSTGSLPGTGLFPDAAPGTAGAITGAVGIGDLKLIIQAHSVHKVENEGTEDREYVVSNLRTFTVEVVLVAKESNSLAPNQLSLQAELLYENGCEVRPTQPDEQVRRAVSRRAIRAIRRKPLSDAAASPRAGAPWRDRGGHDPGPRRLQAEDGTGHAQQARRPPPPPRRTARAGRARVARARRPAEDYATNPYNSETRQAPADRRLCVYEAAGGGHLSHPRARRTRRRRRRRRRLTSRPPPVSLRSKLGRQRFRVRISPKDERIRVANAQLTVLTEPLKSVTKLDRRAPPVDTRVPAGGGSAPLPNLAAPSSIDPPYNPAAANAAAAYRSMSAVEPETASSPPLAAPLALQPPAAAAAMAAAGAGAAGGGSEELRQQLSDSYSLLSRERAERAAMEQRLALQAHDRPPARRLHAACRRRPPARSPAAHLADLRAPASASLCRGDRSRSSRDRTRRSCSSSATSNSTSTARRPTRRGRRATSAAGWRRRSATTAGSASGCEL